jgi:hypothetical protein
MTWWKAAAAVVVAASVMGVPGHRTLAAQDKPSLAGRWTLNRELSQFPREIGFGMDLVPAGGSGSDAGTGGGRGGSGGGLGASAILTRRESEDDVKRTGQLVAEVKSPSPHLTIAETESAVTITNERGQSRTFHPDGKEESLSLDQVPVATTAKWEGARLVVRYKVEEGRELRYTYSRTINPPQLVVQVQFIERGGHDTVTRIYEPTRANEPASPDRSVPSNVTEKTVAGLAGAARAPGFGKPAVPVSPDRLSSPVIAQQPDAELKGLARLGVVVEDLSSQAAACGLKQDVIEAAVSKSLTDAGFKVLRNSDEDTYVYVNIITTGMATGFCVSRYDVFLYTHTTAKLSYQETPVLVQVSLLHNGGLAGGGAAAHAEAVVRGVTQYVDQFATRIRSANK